MEVPVLKKPVEISLSKDEKSFYLAFDFDKKIISAVKRIGGAKWNSRGAKWSFSSKKSKKIVDVVNFLVQHEAQVLLSKKATDLYNVNLEKEKKRRKLTSELEKKKIDETRRDELKTFVDFKKLHNESPYPFQFSTYNYIEAVNGNCIVALDMGLGKTLVSMMYCHSKGLKAIVVCPASLKLNWEEEVSNLLIGATAQVVTKNTEEIDEKATFIVVNYELLVAGADKKGAPKPGSTTHKIVELVKKGRRQALIVDEAHRMKNEQARATKFIHKNFGKIKHKLLLTGTPIKSRPSEYFSLLKFLDKARWSSKVEYCMRYCDPTYNGFAMDFKGASMLNELNAETRRYVIRKEKADVLKDLPAKTHMKIPIGLSEQQMREYLAIEQDVAEHMVDLMEKSNGISDIGKIHELVQFTSRIKVDHCREIIDQALSTGKKIIVFTGYLSIVDKIKEMYGDSCVSYTGRNSIEERQKAKDRFQKDPSCCVFIGSTMAAGVGLTLTAAQYVLFIDEPWTTGDKEQAEDRAHRIGQKENVTVITMVCNDTVDEYKYVLLELKRKVIKKIIDNKDVSGKLDTGSSVIRDVVKMLTAKTKRGSRVEAVWSVVDVVEEEL